MVSPPRRHLFSFSAAVVGYCPLFFCICHALLNCFASLALHLVLGEVESAGHQTILGHRRWWCCVSCVHASSRGLWWSCVLFMGGCRRLGLLCASRVLLLGGHGHLLDGCCRSWAAGLVSVGGLRVTLHWGDVVAKRTWVVVGWCVEVVEASWAW